MNDLNMNVSEVAQKIAESMPGNVGVSNQTTLVKTAEVKAPYVTPNVVGNFYDYDAQVEVPELAGLRTVKCLYRNQEGTTNPKQSSYVRIPSAHISDETIIDKIEELLPHFVAYLQSIEDAEIKKNHSAGISLYLDGLGLDKILELLEASENGARLTKEKIEAWFDSEVSSIVMYMFGSKLGLDMNVETSEHDPELFARLLKAVNAYKAKFSLLAGSRVSLSKPDCAAMLALLNEVEVQLGKPTSLSKRFISKLNKLSETDDELLMSL